MPSDAPARPAPWLKLLIELGPLLLFFVVNAKADIYWATGVFMVAITASLAASWRLERRLPAMSVISGVIVLVFGGLTLLLHDDLFIKLKPTIASLSIAGVLAFGMLRGRSYLKQVMGMELELSDAGWRLLTWRWVGFFVVLAATNEVVWRSFDRDTWVTFKVFGILPLTFVFAIAQVGLINRHALEKADEPASAEEE